MCIIICHNLPLIKLYLLNYVLVSDFLSGGELPVVVALINKYTRKFKK